MNVSRRVFEMTSTPRVRHGDATLTLIRVRGLPSRRRRGDLPVLSLPRIDHRYLQIREMPYVSGSEGGMPRQCDAGNLRVAHIHRPPGLLSLGGQCCSLRCGGAVEIEHPIFEILLEQ